MEHLSHCAWLRRSSQSRCQGSDTISAVRIAALYDIHGNLPALEAVLAEVRDSGIDRVVVGGDVLPGPFVAEVLDRLLERDLPIDFDFILGNGEVAVLAERSGETPRVPPQHRDAIRWVANELHEDHARAIASWPKTIDVDVPGMGRVRFCHATPRNENDIFTRDTPEAPLVPIFESAGAAVVICGHTHMQFDRRIGSVRVVNAGSVGMPFGTPGAYWLTIGSSIELRRTDYDVRAAAARIERTAYPGAAEFAAKYVVNPPSEAQMLAVYASAELK